VKQHILATYGTAIAALALFVFFCIAADNFVNPTNLLNVGKQVSFLAILAIGFSIAFTVAELDLSFAAVCSLCAVVAGGLVFKKVEPVLAVLAAVGVGIAAGVVNGMLVTRLRIPSLIATLAMASVATGTAFAITGGVAFAGRWDPAFLALGRGSVLGIPTLILWTAAVALVALFVLKETRLGMHLVFTGEAEEAARLAGVKVQRMKVLALACAGLCAGLVGTLLAATLNSAAPDMAKDYLLTSIAAVLLGMTMFEPGRCNVPGTLVGAATIGILGNGLVLMGAPYYVQDIMLGFIIVASVAVSASALKKAAFGI
jgi:ribose transport system permease protein